MSLVDSFIFLEKKFSAPIEKIWNAWTDPAFIMNWFGSDPNGKVLKAELNVQPGGNFQITFQDSNLAEHTCFGIYKEVQPFYRLTFSWEWKSEPGVTSFICLRLVPEDNSTKMQFEHRNLGSGSRHNYAQGWQNTFLKLERLLAVQSL